MLKLNRNLVNIFELKKIKVNSFRKYSKDNDITLEYLNFHNCRKLCSYLFNIIKILKLKV